MQRLTDYHVEQGIALGDLRPATVPKEIEGQLVIAPPSAFASPWVQRFRDPVIGFASGWMTVRARARQRGVELPLILSDHVDWPMLTGTLTELAPAEAKKKITHQAIVGSHTALSWDHTPNHVVSPTGHHVTCSPFSGR